MTCLSANKQGADILLDYLGGTLDATRSAELERHAEQCAECQGLLAVSKHLEEWPAPPVSQDFDARLYARIAREEANTPWWKKLLWRPAIPVAAAAGAVLVLALFVKGPGTEDVVTKEIPTEVRPANGADIEQVEQALEDLELLMPPEASSQSHSPAGKM